LRARQAGVIAGTRGIGLGALIGADLPQPHVGVVAVEETVVPGITERITVHVGHTEMLFSSEVARQCSAFLRQAFRAGVLMMRRAALAVLALAGCGNLGCTGSRSAVSWKSGSAKRRWAARRSAWNPS
jgi:hypothetical protein